MEEEKLEAFEDWRIIAVSGDDMIAVDLYGPGYLVIFAGYEPKDEDAEDVRLFSYETKDEYRNPVDAMRTWIYLAG